MTFTYPIINRARRILWLVTGADKSVMLDRLLTADPSIPAGRVSQERAIVFADRAAAGGLQKAAQPQLKELKIFPERRKQKMRVGIITDHGGFSLKEEMVRRLVAVAKAVLGGNR